MRKSRSARVYATLGATLIAMNMPNITFAEANESSANGISGADVLGISGADIQGISGADGLGISGADALGISGGDVLGISGDSKSFSSLVKKFGGDIPPGAMRTEMKRVGAVSEDRDGNLTITDRAILPSEDHEILVTQLVHAVYPLLSNIEHNTNPDEPEGGWASRVAYTQILRSGEKGRLRRVTKDRIVEFAESIDDIFMAYESMQPAEYVNEEKEAIAVGVFYFEERDKNAKYRW